MWLGGQGGLAADGLLAVFNWTVLLKLCSKLPRNREKAVVDV
jgi:hypothetical protein